MQTNQNKPERNTKPSNQQLPTIDIDWIRFPEDEGANLRKALKKPYAFGIYGGKDTGKSALGENIANRYPHLIHIFGARDNEGLAWCRSPRKDSILFLRGPSVEIHNSAWPSVDVKGFRLEDIEKYEAIVSASSFYSDVKEEWYSVARLMEKLWHRTASKELCCLEVKEAASLMYSRVALGDSQGDAKNYIIYVLREMRHCDLAIVMDSIRWFALDIDVRTIADYTFLKAQGIEGLTDNLSFLYSMFDPYGIMRMNKADFILFSRKGPIGYGNSTCPYWHKQEEENLISLLDLKIKYNEKIDLGEKGYARVGDFGHVNIIKARIEGLPNKAGLLEKVGMDKIGENLGHSSRTIMKQINHHNHAIQDVGECDKCTRAGCNYAKMPTD